MATFQFSIPPLLGRLFVRKRVSASLAGRLVEQQRPNEAARVVHELRLKDPDAPVEALAALAGEAMGTEIRVLGPSDVVPRPASPALYLVRGSLERGEVEIVYRRGQRDVRASVIGADGTASGRGYMEFGDIG